MKILYAIQGTGNGHISRARSIIPLLQEKGDVDLLISGTQADVQLDQQVRYQFQGLGFIFGKKGGVDVAATYRKNKLRQLFKEINSLPVHEYDIVINDFEPVSAWACYLQGKPCIGLSHQSAVLHSKAPQPKQADPLGIAILKYYAPSTVRYGFHFNHYGDHIYTPVIREQVRALKPESGSHYTVYLPAYDDDRILAMLSVFDQVEWQVFSKHNTQAFHEKNISIRPISNEAFLESMATSAGVLCGAGFETPAEALFLKKKLMVIPMKGQYEQQCNAAALKKMGVPVLKSLKKKHQEKISSWLESGDIIGVDYPDKTEDIINTLLSQYPDTADQKIRHAHEPVTTVAKFKKLIIRKIFRQLTRS